MVKNPWIQLKMSLTKLFKCVDFLLSFFFNKKTLFLEKEKKKEKKTLIYLLDNLLKLQ